MTNITLLTTKYEMIYGLQNTSAGGDSSLTLYSSSYYSSSEGPINALDQDDNTKYLNFGACAHGGSQAICGLNTGFYVTPLQGPTLLKAFQFTTAGDAPERDPTWITIEGSNATSSALMYGTSWSLIYDASSGLDANPGRRGNGSIQCILSNTIWYTSYRVLVKQKRNDSNSVHYDEIRLLGYKDLNKGK